MRGWGDWWGYIIGGALAVKLLVFLVQEVKDRKGGPLFTNDEGAGIGKVAAVVAVLVLLWWILPGDGAPSGPVDCIQAPQLCY